jgi:beta-galactosidase
MACDLMRSLGGGRPWLLMEQAPSQVNWRAQNVLKRPGQMRLWSLQAVARGAEGIMFFQWRTSRAGAEKFHGAMVPHVGTEQSRVWREVRGLGAELGRLDALLGARVPAEVALVLDWESWWALELDSRPSRDVRLIDAVQRYYDPLYRRNIAVDFVAPDADLGRYKVLLVPNLYLVREGVAPNLERFVDSGGTLVMSFFSGIVDGRDHILLGGYPAPFRALLGLRVEEFDPYVPGQMNRIAVADEGTYACDVWSDVIDLEGAQAVAHFTDDFYAGRAAVTRHAFGQGAAYYLGTWPDESFMDVLLARVCREAGVHPTLEAPAGIEVVRRVRGERSFLFVLNHTRETRDVHIGGRHRDLLTDALHAETISLDPYGVVILDTEPEPAR